MLLAVLSAESVIINHMTVQLRAEGETALMIPQMLPLQLSSRLEAITPSGIITSVTSHWPQHASHCRQCFLEELSS